jgi:WD40 repeat protein
LICDLEFSSDGKQLLITRYDARAVDLPHMTCFDLLCRTISVVDVATGRVKDVVERVVPPNRGLVVLSNFWARDAAFTEEDRAVLVRDFSDRKLKQYDLRTREWKEPLVGSVQNVRDLAVSCDQQVLATTDNGDDVFTWDLKSGKQLSHIMPGSGLGRHGGPLIDLSADGKYVATSGTAGAEIWKASDGTTVTPAGSMPVLVFAIGFSPVEHTLVMWRDTGIWLYDVDRKSTRKLCEPMYQVVFSSDGRKVAAKNRDEVVLLDGLTGKAISRIPSPSQYVNSIAISPDGSRVAIADHEGGLTMWSPGSTSRQIAVPGRKEGHTWPMPFAALVIWAGVCWFIWSRRSRIQRLPDPILITDAP